MEAYSRIHLPITILISFLWTNEMSNSTSYFTMLID